MRRKTLSLKIPESATWPSTDVDITPWLVSCCLHLTKDFKEKQLVPSKPLNYFDINKYHSSRFQLCPTGTGQGSMIHPGLWFRIHLFETLYFSSSDIDFLYKFLVKKKLSAVNKNE